MKFFLCLVLLAVAAVNADNEAVVENPEAKASQLLPLILSTSRPSTPKPSLAPYKPILKVITPIPTTRAPQPLKVKVVSTAAPPKNTIIKSGQPTADNSGAYVKWTE